MRIGIDARLWNETGVGRYTRNLVRELVSVDRKNEYILFVLEKDKKDFQFLTSPKFQIREANIRWHSLQEQLAFPQVLQKENLDLVHFPYFSVPILYSRPFVVTIHDLIVHHFPTGQASTLPYPIYFLKLQGYKYVISQAAKKACAVFAVSQATKAEVVKHLKIPQEKVVVTYEAIDVGVQKKRQNEQMRTGDYFLYVGNAYPHKNLEKLIEAFMNVRRTSLSIKLILVGRNDFFYTRLQNKLQNGVELIVAPNDAMLANLYQHAKALVMPSLMEGFGLPPLEAMANGCPVVISDIPSLREICESAAIYFNPNNASDMAEKMTQVLSLSQKERDSFITLGKKRAQHFSWKKMAEETLKVYESCASKNFGT